MVEEFAFDNAEERRKVRQNGTGWIEVIAGSMFSGKSEELIRRLTRARIARQQVQVFKPGIDQRYSEEEIVGQHFSRFYTEEDRAAGVPARALATALAEGKYESEAWRVRKDGTRFRAGDASP